MLPLVAAMAAGLLALPTLGDKDLWIDEAFTVGAAHQIPESVIARTGSMAIYYLFMAGWKEVSLDPAVLRLPSLIFAALGVGVTVHVARRMFTARVALITAVVLVPMWGVVRYAQEARSYSLVMALSAASWWMILELREPRRDRAGDTGRWVGWALLSAALIYAHPYGAFVLVAQAVAMRIDSPSLGELFRQTRTGLTVLGLAMIPMVLMSFQPEGVFPEWIPPLGPWTVQTTLEMIAGSVGWAQALAAATLVASSIVVGRRASRDWSACAVLLWAWLPLVVLLVISLGRPAVVGRYLIGSLPAVAMIIAVAIDRLPRPSFRVAGAAAIVAITLPGHLGWHRHSGTPWSEAVAVVDRGAADGRSHGVMFLDQWLRQGFEVNARDSGVYAATRPLLPGEPWGELRRYYDAMHGAQIRERVDGVDVVWIIEQDLRSWTGADLKIPDAAEVMDRFDRCLEFRTELANAITVSSYVQCEP